MANHTMIRVHIDWEAAYTNHRGKLTELERFIESFENEYPFSFAPSALEVMFLPIVEALERGYEVDEAEVAETFRKLVAQMAEDPDPRDQKTGSRSVWSVLRAMSSQWCDLPPICRETKPRQ